MHPDCKLLIQLMQQQGVREDDLPRMLDNAAAIALLSHRLGMPASEIIAVFRACADYLQIQLSRIEAKKAFKGPMQEGPVH